MHTIGIGSQDEPVDVGIVDVIRPENVASDGQLIGEIVLKSVGLASEGGSPGNVIVRIESGGKIVWQEQVAASSNQQSVPFVLDVESILGPIASRFAARCAPKHRGHGSSCSGGAGRW